jgi:hypothetical protein
MELIGIILILLVILGHFVEGFAAFNLIQFFRGKETPLEKLTKRSQNKKHNKRIKHGTANSLLSASSLHILARAIISPLCGR